MTDLDTPLACDDPTTGTFFAPVNHDLIDELVGNYRLERDKLEQLASHLNDPSVQPLISYFIDGNTVNDRYRISDVASLFRSEGAIGALNSTYWNRALQLTDVLDCMPQKRRDEWFEQIREHKTPDFDEQTVRSTLLDLMANRATFMAERVDGIFRSLSREHITNSPEGFGKRMILYYATDAYGYPSHARAGVINDLRAVIAKLQGRGELGWNSSYSVLRHLAKHTGQWFAIDGGAIKLRLYKKGTAHIEVHPDIAWRLNMILAHLYPAAIPSQFRQPSARRAKTVDLLQRPLPIPVLTLLSDISIVPAMRPGHFGCSMPHRPNLLNAHREAVEVLKALGGVPMGTDRTVIVFDYDPRDVLTEVVMQGTVPEYKSHQFYPTPQGLAQRVREAAQIQAHHSILEPSAGLGALVADLDPAQVTCVEVSSLHAAVLQEKGFSKVHETDFLSFAASCPIRFDRVLMNPPFSQGRWQAHLEAAARLVADQGRLIAVLPSGAHTRIKLPGFDCSVSAPIENAFEGASVSVVILTAQRS